MGTVHYLGLCCMGDAGCQCSALRPHLPFSIDGIINFTLGHKYSSYRKKNPLAHSGTPCDRQSRRARGHENRRAVWRIAARLRRGRVGGRLEGGVGECGFVATTRTSPRGSRPGRTGSTTVFVRGSFRDGVNWHWHRGHGQGNFCPSTLGWKSASWGSRVDHELGGTRILISI
jgi:hypothetical protein